MTDYQKSTIFLKDKAVRDVKKGLLRNSYLSEEYLKGIRKFYEAYKKKIPKSFRPEKPKENKTEFLLSIKAQIYTPMSCENIFINMTQYKDMVYYVETNDMFSFFYFYRTEEGWFWSPPKKTDPEDIWIECPEIRIEEGFWEGKIIPPYMAEFIVWLFFFNPKIPEFYFKKKNQIEVDVIEKDILTQRKKKKEKKEKEKNDKNLNTSKSNDQTKEKDRTDTSVTKKSKKSKKSGRSKSSKKVGISKADLLSKKDKEILEKIRKEKEEEKKREEEELRKANEVPMNGSKYKDREWSKFEDIKYQSLSDFLQKNGELYDKHKYYPEDYDKIGKIINADKVKSNNKNNVNDMTNTINKLNLYDREINFDLLKHDIRENRDRILDLNLMGKNGIYNEKYNRYLKSDTPLPEPGPGRRYFDYFDMNNP